MTSDQIAESVGTNASYIRKITGLLKKQGIIDSRQGISGFTLLVEPEKLSLLTGPRERSTQNGILSATRSGLSWMI